MIVLDVGWSAINGLSPPDDGEVLSGPPGPAPYISDNLLIFDVGLEGQVLGPLAAMALLAAEL